MSFDLIWKLRKHNQIEKLEKEARAGSADAMAQLLHYNERFPEELANEHLSLLKSFADAGDKKSIDSLLEFYESQRITFGKLNYTGDQKQLIDKMIDEGNTDAYYHLGLFYQYKSTSDDDQCEAIQSYDKAFESGSIKAALKLISIYYENSVFPEDLYKIFNLFKTYADSVTDYSIKKCDMSVVLGLAVKYYLHFGTEESESKCDEILQKVLNTESALKSTIYTIYGMINYHSGTDLDKKEKAFKYFKLAEEDKEDCPLLAKYYLALCYDKGIGTDTDHNKAAAYYETVVKHYYDYKNNENYYRTFIFFTNDKVLKDIDTLKQLCEEDKLKTFNDLQIVSNDETGEKMMQLGLCYQYGIGTEKDDELAYINYLHSCYMGNRTAMAALCMFLKYSNKNMQFEKLYSKTYYFELTREFASKRIKELQIRKI